MRPSICGAQYTKRASPKRLRHKQIPRQAAYDRGVIRIVIAAHASLADALCETCVLIAGRADQISACGLALAQSPEDYERALAALCAPRQAADVLILCDIAYGTPHRIALKLAHADNRIRVLSGVNLAMALEALLGADEDDVTALARRVVEAATADLLT